MLLRKLLTKQLMNLTSTQGHSDLSHIFPLDINTIMGQVPLLNILQNTLEAFYELRCEKCITYRWI